MLPGIFFKCQNPADKKTCFVLRSASLRIPNFLPNFLIWMKSIEVPQELCQVLHVSPFKAQIVSCKLEKFEVIMFYTSFLYFRPTVRQLQKSSIFQTGYVWSHSHQSGCQSCIVLPRLRTLNIRPSAISVKPSPSSVYGTAFSLPLSVCNSWKQKTR